MADGRLGKEQPVLVTHSAPFGCLPFLLGQSHWLREPWGWMGEAKCLVSRTRALRPDRGLLRASHLLSSCPVALGNYPLPNALPPPFRLFQEPPSDGADLTQVKKGPASGSSGPDSPAFKFPDLSEPPCSHRCTGESNRPCSWQSEDWKQERA